MIALPDITEQFEQCLDLYIHEHVDVEFGDDCTFKIHTLIRSNINDCVGKLLCNIFEKINLKSD